MHYVLQYYKLERFKRCRRDITLNDMLLCVQWFLVSLKDFKRPSETHLIYRWIGTDGVGDA